MDVAIIKYNAGNNFSVMCALRRLGVDAVLTDDKDVITNAPKVIFPGVGEAASAMSYLKAHGLDRVIRDLRQPVLGICIGQQLLCRHSEENDVECLGIFDTDVRRSEAQSRLDKIPHMGWNTVHHLRNGIVSKQLDGQYVYYVHSYYVPVGPYTDSVTEYILPFSASMHKDNFYTTQFHPEKSGGIGELILKNFLEL